MSRQGNSGITFEDDVLIAQTPASPTPVSDVPLCFQALYKSGEAKTNTLDVKYAILACEI